MRRVKMVRRWVGRASYFVVELVKVVRRWVVRRVRRVCRRRKRVAVLDVMALII